MLVMVSTGKRPDLLARIQSVELANGMQNEGSTVTDFSSESQRGVWVDSSNRGLQRVDILTTGTNYSETPCLCNRLVAKHKAARAG